MLKICFLLTSELPVPATKGGAVETLVQNIIDVNEKVKKFDITVVTVKDTALKDIRAKYKYTKFYEVRNIKFLNKMYWKYVGFCRKVLKKEIVVPLQKIGEIKFLRRNSNNYDYFVEELQPDAYCKLRDNIEKSKLIYHLHSEGKPSYEVDSSFANLIAISKFVADSWKEKTGRTKDTIYELPNCINVNNFNKVCTLEEKKCLLNSLKIKNEKNIILFVGRIVPEKGIKELIDAIDLITDRDIVLLIIGRANFGKEEETEFERIVLEKIQKSSHQVIHLGFVHNTELYKYQSISDIAIVPSIWNEPAGLVVLEHQGAGLPVIATSNGGIPQFLCPQAGVLIDYDKEFIFNLSQKIIYLLKNDTLRKQMGEYGRGWAENFDIKCYYDNFSSIIERIDLKNNNLDGTYE